MSTDAEPTDGGQPADSGRPGQQVPQAVVFGSAGLAVAAAVFAGWAGWSWISVGNDDTLGFTRAREEARAAGQQAVLNFNTMDYRRFDELYNLWRESSTGALFDSLPAEKDGTKKQLEDKKLVTEPKALDVAIIDLDQRTGRAKLLATVDPAVKQDGKPAAAVPVRVGAELTRVDGTWKLSGLQPIVVGRVG